MTLYGPDLSNNNWNSTGEIAGWLDDCFFTEGFSWLEHKVSEGNYYSDPFWPVAAGWCLANDVPCVGYHYVTTDPVAQQVAQWIGNGGGTRAMLDFEDNSGDINNFWALVAAFQTAGVTVVLSYIPHWYWQDINSPTLVGVPGLISSSYYASGTFASTEYEEAGGDTGIGWGGYGGVTPIIWQFTSGAIIDGKSVDANAFKGSLSDLETLLGMEPTITPAQALLLQQVHDQLCILWPELGERADGKGGRTLVDAVAHLLGNPNA